MKVRKSFEHLGPASTEGSVINHIRKQSRKAPEKVLSAVRYHSVLPYLLQSVRLSCEHTLTHELVKVKPFVAYPILGLLKHVGLHMNSFEFLHRAGFRKLDMPFDERVLVLVKSEIYTSSSPETSPEPQTTT